MNHFSPCLNSRSVYRIPKIAPVEPQAARPLWSVIIPTYNGEQYLEKTLQSVLAQALEPEKMQIEVVDDCSTSTRIESIVQEIGQGRVNFFRNPRNLGLVGNWNACIDRARGDWVHILHQDDVILPGFYSHLQAALTSDAAIGAAFCRHVFIDEEDIWLSLSPVERRTPGILEQWIDCIAVVQRIQFPSIVVKREAYERLGGFCAEAHYAADWEMWKRIAAHYSVWYEPKVLACYRQHSGSETSRLVRSGADIADIRRAIDISAAYLPAASAQLLSQKAREHYALYALKTARRLLFVNDVAGAAAQIRGAFACSCSRNVLYAALPLVKSIGKRWILAQWSGK